MLALTAAAPCPKSWARHDGTDAEPSGVEGGYTSLWRKSGTSKRS